MHKKSPGYLVNGAFLNFKFGLNYIHKSTDISNDDGDG